MASLEQRLNDVFAQLGTDIKQALAGTTSGAVTSQTFFAEENAALSTATNGGFQWSAGNGDETSAANGVVALLSGTMTVIACEVEGTGSYTVELYLNGVATSITNSCSNNTASFTDISVPISKGDIINYRTTANSGTTVSGRVSALLIGNVAATGEIIASGATGGQVPTFNALTGEYEPSDPPSGGGADSAVVGAIAAGSTLGLQQELLAKSGQPALTVLAVGFTTSGKVQGVSLGDGNVIEVYFNGDDFNNGIVLFREFMSLGEPICFDGLTDGSIITSTQGFYGFSEQVDGGDESPMPLLSYGLSFKSSFFFAFRNSQTYNPTSTLANQGWVHVVNGPLVSEVELTTGTGVVVQGQTAIELQPWEYRRLYTSGNQEYILNATNPIMACHAANMDSNPFGRFYDSRLIMPLTNDGITWPRSGFVSAPFDNTNWDYFVRDGASGSSSTSPGSPTDFDGITGANDADYEPNGATRVLATGLVSAYSGADSAGLEASPMMPTFAMSQVVAQPLYIADTGDGGDSGVAIASPYEGTAKIWEWNTVTNSLDLAYTVPLVRTGVTVSSKEDQKHPAAGLVANETVSGSIPLAGQLDAGIVTADVPITVVVQNGTPSLTPQVRSQNGTTINAIITQDDETLSLGWTPATIKAEIVEGADNILYRRAVTGGTETWIQA